MNDEEPSPSSDAISVTREDIPPTEGGRGIPRTCCWVRNVPASRDSGRSVVFAIVVGTVQAVIWIP